MAERIANLLARIDSTLARANYTPRRPLWVDSKPVWEATRVSLPTDARDVAFGQLFDGAHAACDFDYADFDARR